MPLSPGTHRLGPGDGSLQVRTYREGVAQKVGHDLVLGVAEWEATVEVAPDGTPAGVALEADPHSLQVLEGLHGVKPLSDRDRREIRKNIDEKVLGGQPVAFRSSAVQRSGGRLTIGGELTLAGTARPADFEIELADDGRITGTLAVIQSEWGIKPYRGFMGALKVRDAVDVVVDARLAG